MAPAHIRAARGCPISITVWRDGRAAPRAMVPVVAGTLAGGFQNTG